MTVSDIINPEANRDVLDDILLDRKYTSIYDIAHLYGRLHTTYLSVKYEDVDVGQKYIQQRLTPEARPAYFDQDIGMVSVPVDVSSGAVQVATAGDVEAAEPDGDSDSVDSAASLYAEPVDREKLLRVGYSRQDSRAAGHNMSLAHDITDKSPTQCSKYFTNIFSKWIQSDEASKVTTTHPNGDLIKSLASFEEVTISKLEESIKKEFEKRFPDGFTGVLSLRIRTEEGGRFRYPGEFEVLNEVTRRRWIANQMRSYSGAADSSGTATDFVTGESGKVYGVSDSPLERHQANMAESFPGLSPDESWRNRPLSSDTAFDVIAGSSIIKQFVQLLREDTRLYVIPYLPDPTPDEAVALYNLARKAMDDNGQIISVLGDEFTDRSSPLYDANVRLHYSIVYEPGRKAKILIEEPSVPVRKIRAIADAHRELLESTLLVGRASNPPLFPSPPYGRINSKTEGDDYDGSEYLMASKHDAVFNGLVNGGYWASTFVDRKVDVDDDNYGASDPLTIATRQCLGPNTKLNPEWLLNEYVPRLEKEQRSSFGEDGLPVPDSLLTRQYVQYQALALAGVLAFPGQQSVGESPPLTQPVQIETMTDQAQQMAEGASFETREERLEQFIEAHPALAQNDERQGAFLLGALVGRLAAYQKSPTKDLSRTVMRQHPIDSITLQRFSTTLSQVLDKNAVYSEEDENVYAIMNARYVERLNDIVHQKPPDEWELSTPDLRMHYGLGLSYGRNDTSIGDYSDDENSDE